MVGHGGILAFDERTDMRALAAPPARVRRRTRAAASASPAGSGSQRAHEMFDRPGDRSTATRLEALLETLELGSLCAHGGGMPAPIRSLLAHFPERAGAAGPSRSTTPTTGAEDGARTIRSGR